MLTSESEREGTHLLKAWGGENSMSMLAWSCNREWVDISAENQYIIIVFFHIMKRSAYMYITL